MEFSTRMYRMKSNLFRKLIYLIHSRDKTRHLYRLIWIHSIQMHIRGVRVSNSTNPNELSLKSKEIWHFSRKEPIPSTQFWKHIATKTSQSKNCSYDAFLMKLKILNNQENFFLSFLWSKTLYVASDTTRY